MRTFENLIKDLDEEKEGTRIVCNIDKFEKALGDPLPGILDFRVFFYICFNTPVNGVIPPLERIAGDLKMEIETVKKEIEKLKYYGALEG